MAFYCIICCPVRSVTSHSRNSGMDMELPAKTEVVRHFECSPVHHIQFRTFHKHQTSLHEMLLPRNDASIVAAELSPWEDWAWGDWDTKGNEYMKLVLEPFINVDVPSFLFNIEVRSKQRDFKPTVSDWSFGHSQRRGPNLQRYVMANARIKCAEVLNCVFFMCIFIRRIGFAARLLWNWLILDIHSLSMMTKSSSY